MSRTVCGKRVQLHLPGWRDAVGGSRAAPEASPKALCVIPASEQL